MLCVENVPHDLLITTVHPDEHPPCVLLPAASTQHYWSGFHLQTASSVQQRSPATRANINAVYCVCSLPVVNARLHCYAARRHPGGPQKQDMMALPPLGP